MAGMAYGACQQRDVPVINLATGSCHLWASIWTKRMIDFESSRRYCRRAGVRYLVATLSVAAVLILTLGPKQLFPATPNALYFCAIMSGDWFNGFGPAMFASVLTSAAVKGGWQHPHFRQPTNHIETRKAGRRSG